MITTRRIVFGRVADSIIAFILMVAVVTWVDGRHPYFPGIAEFFQMRLTLLNACFSLAFAVAWAECFKKIEVLIQNHRGLSQSIVMVACGCAIMTAIVGLYLALRRSNAPTFEIVRSFFVVALVCQILRLVLARQGWNGQAEVVQNAIILGSGRRASKAWRELRTRYGRTINLLGFVDDRDMELVAPDIVQRFICSTGNLSGYLLHNSVHQLILAIPLRSQYDMTQRAISIAEAAGLRVICLSDSFTLAHGRSLSERNSVFTELLQSDEHRRLADGVKRIFDIILAFCGLVVLAPLFLLISVLIKVSSRGPVFFCQERYGYHRRRFRIWKFRSMVANAPELLKHLEAQNEADGPLFKIKEDPRITSVGKYLRKLSLDELPQLWNVLLGDMSLVGPRPMSVRDVSRFSDAQLMRRFTVKPGITGLWQVSGRSSLSFDKWMALDFLYIDEWSLGLDLKILALTVPVVLKRTGAS